MALKFIVDTLEGLSTAVSEHYAAKDGKYQLALDGGHPDTAKVSEFRDNNTGLKKELARFDGIDPEAVKADRARLAAFEQAKPDERISALEAKLAEANRRASSATLRDLVGAAF